MNDDTDFDDDERALRDVEEGLVAALQESDTAVETLQDSSHDTPRRVLRTRRTVTIAGLLLALLALIAARRRS